jgi:hypothetical protein
MGEILQTPQGICVSVVGLKDDGGAQILCQTTLPGNAKFGGEIAAHFGYGMYCNIHISTAPF